MTTGELAPCVCGSEWVTRGGLRICVNCDTVQAQEAGLDPKPRNRTPHDSQYDLYWTHQMKDYPPLSEKDEADIRALFE